MLGECSAQAVHTVGLEVFVGQSYVTKFAPRKAQNLIARGKLTFDRRVVLHRVADKASAAWLRPDFFRVHGREFERLVAPSPSRGICLELVATAVRSPSSSFFLLLSSLELSDTKVYAPEIVIESL